MESMIENQPLLEIFQNGAGGRGMRSEKTKQGEETYLNLSIDINTCETVRESL